MSRSKTDYRMLESCGKQLESYAKENGFEIIRCSQYQWNVINVFGNKLLSVYPGSGLIYAVKLHYTNTGLVDDTGKKFYFSNKSEMVNELNSIMFKEDSL